jgi:hypothetical protein
MNYAFATLLEPLKSCDFPHFSFYEFIESIWGEEPSGSDPLHRMGTLLRKMKVASFLQETLELNEELQEEEESVSRFLRKQVRLDAMRVTFFDFAATTNWQKSTEAHLSGGLLGYAVVVTLNFPDGTQRHYLFEAVVKKPAVINSQGLYNRVVNYYIHNSRAFQTTIGTRDKSKQLSIEGCFFTQQNGITSNCSHAALRMAVNNSSLLGTKKLTNSAINNRLLEMGDKPEEIRRGLDSTRITAIIKQLGGSTIVADFLKHTYIEYDEVIYPFLESGCPVILGVQGYDPKDRTILGHVMSVLGHTLNTDRWEPEARNSYGNYPTDRFLPITKWVDHYIINDDNKGMYLTLPSDMLRNMLVPNKNPNLHAAMALAIIPKEVQLHGRAAQWRSFMAAHTFLSYLSSTNTNPWINRLQSYHEQGELVLRTLLVKRSEYVRHLEEVVNKIGVKISEAQYRFLESIPEYLWLSEISVPHVFTGNKGKLGDILIRPDQSLDELSKNKYGNGGLVWGWAPGLVFFNNKPDKWPIVHRHVPIFRRQEDDPPVPEW